MNGSKSTSKVKLKTASQGERLQNWKEHFKNLVENSPEITDKEIKKIISNQQDINLEQFTEGKVDVVLKKIKNKKAAGLDEIPPEENLMTFFLNHETICINKTQ